MKMNRAAFQILFAKLRAPPGGPAKEHVRARRRAISSAMRTASVPYCSVTTSGSMTLPLVFDISAVRDRAPGRGYGPVGTEPRP